MRTRILLCLVSLGALSCHERTHLRVDLAEGTALDRYVAREDPNFTWGLERTLRADGYTVHVLGMVSQRWRSRAEVNRPLWRHWLTIVKPREVRSKTALLFIDGGSNDSEIPEEISTEFVQLALLNGAVVVQLSMVPNQPLVFSDDSRPRREDDLIAHTWNKYMETGDEFWPAQLPMANSAVRAMDAVEAFLAIQEEDPVKITGFVVSGASKRGWTTWLAGAVDRRVVAIIPIVIDVLNVQRSMEHHHAAYGFWAPALGDYERNRISEKESDPRYAKLMEMVDPYSYRSRLSIPKYMVNSAGDQFFLPDSSQFYFHDLVGEKYLRYVPNTDHSLRDSDALEGLEAFFRAVITSHPRPKFSWTMEEDGSIRVRPVKVEPGKVLLWQASNPEARDFRLMTIGKAWKSTVLTPGEAGEYVGRISVPESGWSAFFVELSFESGGPNPFKFTTDVRVLPDVLPHADE